MGKDSCLLHIIRFHQHDDQLITDTNRYLVGGWWMVMRTCFLLPAPRSNLVPKGYLNPELIELLFYILGSPWHLVYVAGEFKTCTILFSDVVTFTNICAACKPIQIVNMLNSMYSKLDRLTSVHEVYKVSKWCPGLCVSLCVGAGCVPGAGSSVFLSPH